ncbi:MAG: nucleotide exchange factor GrpE [Sulfurimonas sp.]|uniref:nucleotide exchange factor GrpE n=1 Tax=Sulfurimonas sp. TaxID=2022749 RepID=UPI0026242814|nr:nucleotide exchange factor GrpE [Sulfurimonas sp.]MCW8895884.1 nucleotide exchange factor GrpE [Sulfurimonas sp.]MCW8954937.1 nucleotide exchange factor GrpE [Sulfurimonas sp.]MCW9067568.1 nucleotide exchange factor GrpE [Sulfurimonas sp.]
MSNQNDEELQNKPLENEEEKVEISDEEAEADSEAVENELDLLQNELTELKEKYARVHADFDNIKKRLEREKYTAVEYSNEKFAKDMIPVMDALQMALTSTATVADPQEHLNKLNEGIELTLKQFTTSLEKHGVTMVAHDEPFDPNIHNAVQSVESEDVESGQIVQTFQTGYRYKNRPLREAMVIVAK